MSFHQSFKINPIVPSPDLWDLEFIAQGSQFSVVEVVWAMIPGLGNDSNGQRILFEENVFT